MDVTLANIRVIEVCIARRKRLDVTLAWRESTEVTLAKVRRMEVHRDWEWRVVNISREGEIEVNLQLGAGGWRVSLAVERGRSEINPTRSEGVEINL
jgi:hypothetical protein